MTHFSAHAARSSFFDEAGWVPGPDGIREKDGVRMQITYQTSVNPLRQKEQEIAKDSFEQIGIGVTLKAVEAGVFFSSDAGNPDTYAHFYTDIEMYTNSPTTPYPLDYMLAWYGDESNIPQEANQWSGDNVERWQNDEYDRLYEQARTELDPDAQPDLFIQMNDLVVNNVVEIAEVHRNGVAGAAKNLQDLELSPWTSDLWNLANWTRAS